MTALTIRRATEADLPAIVAMLADDTLGAARERPGDPAYAAAFAAIDADPNQLLAVAEADGTVVGTLQLSVVPGLSLRGATRAEIEAVRVASPHRGAGIGREMLLWAVERARQRGCALVQLTTNAARADAQRFYERLGFRGTHRGFKLPLRDDLL